MAWPLGHTRVEDRHDLAGTGEALAAAWSALTRGTLCESAGANGTSS
jgi:hypothetical protein